MEKDIESMLRGQEIKLSKPSKFFYGVLECFPLLTSVYVKATELSQYLPKF
ncbi:hypothetical protein GOV03_03225 [Candidatus Woesearchaeota archaeon]|nr:hypothetical protein [Candidatus Woesearchaeota archaeon]